MVLTTYQKELIKLIEEGNIRDIYTFFYSVDEISKIKYLGTSKQFEYENPVEKKLYGQWINSGDELLCYDKDDYDIVKSKLMEFIFLTNYLEKQNLIRATKLSEGSNRKFYAIVNTRNNETLTHAQVSDLLNQLTFEGYRYVFEASPAIKEFIKRGYLSDSDHKFKISNKWTKIVAGIAFLGIIATTIVQVIFSGKERDVIINNKNAFQDTAKVLIINPQNNYFDTSKGNSK